MIVFHCSPSLPQLEVATLHHHHGHERACTRMGWQERCREQASDGGAVYTSVGCMLCLDCPVIAHWQPSFPTCTLLVDWTSFRLTLDHPSTATWSKQAQSKQPAARTLIELHRTHTRLTTHPMGRFSPPLSPRAARSRAATASNTSSTSLRVPASPSNTASAASSSSSSSSSASSSNPHSHFYRSKSSSAMGEGSSSSSNANSNSSNNASIPPLNLSALISNGSSPPSSTTKRGRSSSILSMHEIKENYDDALDQSAMANLNADWVNYKGESRKCFDREATNRVVECVAGMHIMHSILTACHLGAWLIHIVLIVVGKILVDSIPSIEQDTSWTIVLQGYLLVGCTQPLLYFRFLSNTELSAGHLHHVPLCRGSTIWKQFRRMGQTHNVGTNWWRRTIHTS